MEFSVRLVSPGSFPHLLRETHLDHPEYTVQVLLDPALEAPEFPRVVLDDVDLPEGVVCGEDVANEPLLL